MEFWGSRLDPGCGKSIEIPGYIPVAGQFVGITRILVGAPLLAVSLVAAAVCQIGIYRWTRVYADPSAEGCVDKQNKGWWTDSRDHHMRASSWAAAHIGFGLLDITGLKTVYAVTRSVAYCAHSIFWCRC